jgi:hypothetical protein
MPCKIDRTKGKGLQSFRGPHDKIFKSAAVWQWVTPAMTGHIKCDDMIVLAQRFDLRAPCGRLKPNPMNEH